MDEVHHGINRPGRHAGTTEEMVQMAESRDTRVRIERAIERAQKELLQASHQLAKGITREADRIVPPVSRDLERMVDDVFDVAQRVLKSQRAMVSDVMRAVNEQAERAAKAGREATGRTRGRATAKKATAKKATATKTVAKSGPAGKVPARKPVDR